MKLIRFGEAGQEKPGVLLDSGRRKDVSTYFKDWNHDFLQNQGLVKLARMLKEKGDTLPDAPANARLGSCVARPGKIIGIGLNYRDHAAETKAQIPAEPVVFMKATTSLSGPFDPILIPRKSEQTDWEVELAVIIGRDTRYLNSVADAKDVIAGYSLANDVSERHFQRERGGLWDKGKSCDSFFPLGPFLATPDEVGDPQKIDLTLEVNGERMQTGNTANMIFTAAFIVHYLSHFMTLEAGDVITTGTPAGVGMGHVPPRFLKPGDIVEATGSCLGRQRLVCGKA